MLPFLVLAELVKHCGPLEYKVTGQMGKAQPDIHKVIDPAFYWGQKGYKNLDKATVNW